MSSPAIGCCYDAPPMPKGKKFSSAKPTPRSSPRQAPPASPALSSVAWTAAALAAAGCLLASASFTMFDTDIWQHLVRAKAMLALHGIPRTNIWTWPLYGQPERNAAWAFALLLWPFWKLGGVAGLFVFRWLTTLSVFGSPGAARRAARGAGALDCLLATERAGEAPGGGAGRRAKPLNGGGSAAVV